MKDVQKEKWECSIDTYKDAIYAMVGFANLYWYDDKTERAKNNVVVTQGRRLVPAEGHQGDSKYLTPDIVIVVDDKEGVLAEVKSSWPRDEDLWLERFQQLLRYDQELRGWPGNRPEPRSHDIVLLTTQFRSSAVCRYYRTRKESKQICFQRPFVIIEFNRSDERRAYFFFRAVEGAVSSMEVSEKLRDGVGVPMEPYLDDYSMVKFYDSEPPMPYLMHVIWQDVIAQKAFSQKEPMKLKRGEKRPVEIGVDQLVNELREHFSFKALYMYDDDRQPKIPDRNWVKKACDKFVQGKLAEWAKDDKNPRLTFIFQWLEEGVLDRLIKICGRPPGVEDEGLLFSTTEDL